MRTPRPVGTRIDVGLRWRARIVPPASVLAASALAALPLVAEAPVLPPFGLLVALAWRLLRPEMWQAWAALPLGLADDLLGGQPPGAGMILWTLAFLCIEFADNRVVWHDHWRDWVSAALVIALVLVGGWFLTGLVGHAPPRAAGVVTIVPQLAVAILCFPVAVRVVARLDRWRLA